jgi:hypothetical protein
MSLPTLPPRLEEKKAYTNEEAGTALRQEAGPRNCQCKLKPHLINDEAQPGEASILARWDGG